MDISDAVLLADTLDERSGGVGQSCGTERDCLRDELQATSVICPVRDPLECLKHLRGVGVANYKHILRWIPVALLCGCSQLASEDAKITSELMDRGLPNVMARHAVRLERMKLPQIVLTPRRARDLPIRVSKFRGQPYWPKDRDYPTDPQGNPMVMLVQLNFAELPKLAEYPTTGILQFFIAVGSAGNELLGMRLDGSESDGPSYLDVLRDQTFFRVVYHETIVTDDAALRTDLPMFDDPDLPIPLEGAVASKLSDSYVQTSDYRFKRIFDLDYKAYYESVMKKDFSLVEQYRDFLGGYRIAVIGGYSRVEQGFDPRSLVPDEDWLVLLSIDTTPENDLDMLWEDGGVANWWIKREDLQQKDFSRVIYYWDSG